MKDNRKYVSSSEKAEIVLKSLCQKSPQTISELTETLVKTLPIKPTTARSSVTRIVNDLIEIGILEEVGSAEKGAKLVDFTPYGIYLITISFPHTGAKYITMDDILHYLHKKNKEIEELLRIYLYLKSDKEEEEEEEFSSFLETLDLAADLEEEEINNWKDLEDSILDLCIMELEEYIDKRGGLLYLEELMSKMPKELKRAYKRVLYSYKDKIEEEIKNYELRKNKIQELISKLSKTTISP